MSPTLTPDAAAETERIVCRIGGVLRDPAPQKLFHDANANVLCMLYVAESVTGEPSSLLAMLYGYTLVNPTFLRLLAQVVRDSSDLSMSRWPQPRACDVERAPCFADCVYHRPEPAFYEPLEFLQQAPRTSNTVFRLMHLIFIDAALHDALCRVVEEGGGRTTLVESSFVTSWIPLNADLPLTGLVDVTDSHGKNAFVLCPAATCELLLEHIASPQLSPLPSDDGGMAAAYFHLFKHGITIVHEHNIHISIFTNHTSSQFRANAPGVLSRSAMNYVDSDDDADSDDTQEDPITITRRRPVTVYAAEQVLARPVSREFSAPQPSGTPPGEQRNAPGDLYEQWRSKQELATSLSRVHRGHDSVAVSPVSGGFRAPSTSRGLGLNRAQTTPTRSSSLQRRTVSPSRRAFTNDEKLYSLCGEFEAVTLRPLAARVADCCRAVARHGFIDGSGRALLDGALERVTMFLDGLRKAEQEVRPCNVTQPTRRAIYDVQQQADALLRSVRATYRGVGIEVPASYSPRRSVAAHRTPSPSRFSTPPRQQVN